MSAALCRRRTGAQGSYQTKAREAGERGCFCALSFFLSPQIHSGHEKFRIRPAGDPSPGTPCFSARSQKRHHHIFALLSHVPRVVFRILVDDVSKQSPDKMTIPEFLKTYRTFPPSRTYLTVTYRTYLLKEEWDLLAPDMDSLDIPFNGMGQTVCTMPEQLEMIEDEFDGILIYFMREAMLEGRPFLMSQADCDEFELTPADAEALEASVIGYNRKIRAEFLEDRNRLDEILKYAEKVPLKNKYLHEQIARMNDKL